MKNSLRIGKEKKAEREHQINKHEIGFTNQKKKKMIYLSIIIVLIMVILIYFVSKAFLEARKTNQERVTEYIEKLAKDFYEDYYYPQLNDMKENELIEDIPTFLSNFEQRGIPISLNQLIEVHYKTESEINKVLKNYQCSFEETGFQIYPQSPYQKDSYKLDLHIVCENLSKEGSDS